MCRSLARLKHDGMPCLSLWTNYNSGHKKNKFPQSRNVYREEIEMLRLCAPKPFAFFYLRLTQGQPGAHKKRSKVALALQKETICVDSQRTPSWISYSDLHNVKSDFGKIVRVAAWISVNHEGIWKGWISTDSFFIMGAVAQVSILIFSDDFHYCVSFPRHFGFMSTVLVS
jgi:hypothetical protein